MRVGIGGARAADLQTNEDAPLAFGNVVDTLHGRRGGSPSTRDEATGRILAQGCVPLHASLQIYQVMVPGTSDASPAPAVCSNILYISQTQWPASVIANRIKSTQPTLDPQDCEKTGCTASTGTAPLVCYTCSIQHLACFPPRHGHKTVGHVDMGPAASEYLRYVAVRKTEPAINSSC